MGSYRDAGGKPHGFLLNGGNFTTIDFPDASGTWAFGINDNDQIVGPYKDVNGKWHGFLFEDGSFTTIDFPDAPRTEAKGINDTGKVVGYYKDAGGKLHGFLLDGDSFTTIDFPNATGTRAFRINDTDSIVGEYEDVSGWHGFLLEGSSFVTIDVPAATKTRAIGINDTGSIVGRYWDASRWHGFLLVEGNFTTIDFPHAIGARAIGINNANNIVGRYWDDSEGRHGFIAIPNKCADTIYYKGSSYIKFNRKKDSRGKAFLRLCVEQAFCDALKAGSEKIVLKLSGCNDIEIPGSKLKSNKSKTRFKAKSVRGATPGYKLKINCSKGELTLRLKNTSLGCVSNPVKTCIYYIDDDPCLCAKEEFIEELDKKERLKKLSLMTAGVCAP